MKKGKFGLNLAAVAVIAFGFSALRQPQSVLLVAGFALLAEKDEWLNRQAMQALLLTIAYYVAELVTDWIFGGLVRFFGWVELYDAASAMSKVDSFVGDVLYLTLIVFSVLSALRVLRGKDAGLPFLSKMADGDITAALRSRTRTPETSMQTGLLDRLCLLKHNTQLHNPRLVSNASHRYQDAPAPVPGCVSPARPIA